MINFQAIREGITNFEYGFDKPESLVVLVPVVSLIFQKIQVSDLKNTLKTTFTRPDQLCDRLNSREYAKLDTVNQWHTFGSLIQTISLCFLATFCHPLFLIPAAFSIYELNSSIHGLTNEVIHLRA